MYSRNQTARVPLHAISLLAAGSFAAVVGRFLGAGALPSLLVLASVVVVSGCGVAQSSLLAHGLQLLRYVGLPLRNVLSLDDRMTRFAVLLLVLVEGCTEVHQ